MVKSESTVSKRTCQLSVLQQLQLLHGGLIVPMSIMAMFTTNTPSLNMSQKLGLTCIQN